MAASLKYGINGRGIPCLDCDHPSRDHLRSKKQPDGTWNGKCGFDGCECKLYRKGEKA